MNKSNNPAHSKDNAKAYLKKINPEKCEEIFKKIKKEAEFVQTKWEDLAAIESSQPNIYKEQIKQLFASFCTMVENLFSKCSIEERSFLIAAIATSWSECSQKQQKEKTDNSRKAAQTRHQNSPQGKAKQQVKEMWLAWQEDPSQYRNATAFAEHMLEKFPNILTNRKTIQGWQTNWKKELKNQNENTEH